MLYDVDEGQVTRALHHIQSELVELEGCGTLRGSLTADQQVRLITGTDSLAQCLLDTVYVQVGLTNVLQWLAISPYYC